jgi:cysteine desulfurase
VKAAPIYMDYNATTPVDPRVVEAMLPCFVEHFGNAGSHTHAFGWAAAKLVDLARANVAASLGVDPEEVIFTSGATESNNIAIKGAARALGSRGRRLVTCATEHKAVLDPCHALTREGFEVVVLPVESDGRLDPAAVTAALGDGTVLVSVMLANNETGTVHAVAEIAAACHQRGVLVHCDATQAVGKIPVNVGSLGVDLLSLSAHKVYGPKGVGALIRRRRKLRLSLVPIVDGGGQEQGLRSGTLNVPGIVGLARALELCMGELDGEGARLAGLRDRLEEGIKAQLEGVVVNGCGQARLPNTSNLSFAGVDGSALLAGLREIAVAIGSACTSADPRPSHVLTALGRSRELAAASVRFSLGRGSAAGDVETATTAVVREVNRLRLNSPLWRGRR